MADKETGLNITVGAVADENSAAQAAKDLTKGVLSSLKDGYIEVPAEIKVPIKGASKELEQAQKKVLTQWRKTFKKGFSSSEEDLSELTKAYKKFKELSKGKAKEEQSKWITNVIGKQIASYKRQLTKQAKPVEKTTAAKTKSPRNFGKHTKAKIDANIKAEQKRRIKGTKSTGPAGYSSGWIDPGRTNEREAKLSELSSYASNMARQIRQSEKESKTWEKASLNITKPGEEAIEQAIVDARKNGNNKNQFSPEEKALGLSDIIRKNLLPELINKIKKSEDDAEITKLSKEFFDTLTAISNLNIEAGKLIISDVNKTLGITMGALGFTTSGNIGGTEGDKEDLSKDPKMQSLLKGLLNKVAEKENDILQQTIKLEQLEKNSGTKIKLEKSINNFANRIIANSHVDTANQAQNSKEVVQAVSQNQKAIETNTSYDKIENSAERVADNASGQKTDKLIKDADEDLGSGFNTDLKSDSVISTLQSILSEIQSITKNGLNVVGLQKGQTNTRSNPSLLPVPVQPEMQQALKNFDYVKKYGKSQAVSGDISSSEISTTVKDPHSWVTKLKDAFADLTKTTANYKVIMAKTSEEQNKMSAERIRKYGISRGSGPTDTGDKTMIARRLSLFRNKDYFKTLFKDINLSEGIKIDTTDVTDKLAKALSGREMFKAQTGGWLKNILGAATGGVAFAFQPSLEKSRARAEGVNQIMANIRKVLNDTLQDIQDKESKLRGMKASGDLKLDAKGNVLESSSTEAKTLVLQLQESKDALNSILADTKYVDEVVSRTHGRIGGMIKQLGFTSPMLRKNNAILANLNAGLDKGGKALKYQTRMAELLGYSFRLIARHVGQTFKNLILNIVSFLNPLTHIKKAFQDFMGYNTKWQRTMNVIKYNIRAILQPFMDKVAQFLVNCIGFIDIISMKVQEAFGNIPISLFDQAAAQSEKIHEELEAAANVTAGFDELHDIGSDNSGANDLMGDIYKPELPQDWIDLANKIGDLFAGLIKGDLGFGEVMGTILGLLLEGLGKIASAIWEWFKQTAIGKWITENWKKLLLGLLAVFLGWKLLKIAGGLLWSALTSGLTQSAFGGLLGKILGWVGTGIKSIGTLFLNALTSTQFGSDMVRGFKGMFTSGGMIGAFKSGAASLGTIFAQGLVATAGIAIGAYGYAKGFDMAADDASYNSGLMAAGGKEKDKKASTGAYATSMGLGAAGGAITGFAIGGPIGALIGGFIGAVGGAITTSLAPAYEELEIAARNANNEMQKIEYYEGAVQGAASQVDSFTQIVDMLNNSLTTQVDAVYKQGEQLGISKMRMDYLVESVKNGTFNTDMLSGSEEQLADKLVRLDALQQKATDSSDKLTEAKRKLAKAEVDSAIAKDIEAGDFEMAEARIEVAWASEVYTTEEASKKISQILKKGNAEQRASVLDNLSKEMDNNWREYITTTDQGAKDVLDIYKEMSEEEKKTFSQDYAEEARIAMQKTVDAMQEIIDNAGFFDGMKSKIAEAVKVMTVEEAKNKGFQISSHAIGTNYVPNDGLTYVHKGEAIVPADQNVFADQGKAFSAQSMTNAQLLNAITNLEAQMKQGIEVRGQFVQKGTDLVASVEKTTGKLSNSILNNRVYAR